MGRRGKKKPKTKPRIQNRIRVATPLGSDILRPNDKVWVVVGDGRFQKAACDLRQGEVVVFKKEVLKGGGTEISLDSVDGVLRQSKRYRNTQPLLFVECDDGTVTTRLRHCLLSGAFDSTSGSSWPNSITSDLDMLLRIKASAHNGPSPSQLEDAARLIRETLEDRSTDIGNPVVSNAQVERGWLAGVTLAPKEFQKVFEALEMIAPALGELKNSEEFRNAYHTYTVIRRMVMRAINDVLSVNAKSRNKGPGKNSKDSISTRPEIQLVVDHFIEDVDERFAYPRVLGIEEVEPKGKYETGVLARGISNKLDDADARIKDLRQISLERAVILQAVHKILHSYLKKYYPGGMGGVYSRCECKNLVLDHAVDLIGYEGIVDLLRETLERFKRKGINVHDFGQSDLLFNPLVKEHTELFIERLEAGKVDSIFGFENGTCYRVVDLHGRLFVSQPKVMGYQAHVGGALMHLQRLNSFVGLGVRATSTKPLDQEYKRIQKQIYARYGKYREYAPPVCVVEPAFRNFPYFVDSIHDQLYGAENAFSVVRRIAGAESLEMMMSAIKVDAQSDIVTRKQAKEVLKSYNLRELLSAIPPFGE